MSCYICGDDSEILVHSKHPNCELIYHQTCMDEYAIENTNQYLCKCPCCDVKIINIGSRVIEPGTCIAHNIEEGIARCRYCEELFFLKDSWDMDRYAENIAEQIVESFESVGSFKSLDLQLDMIIQTIGGNYDLFCPKCWDPSIPFQKIIALGEDGIKDKMTRVLAELVRNYTMKSGSIRDANKVFGFD